MNTDHLRSAYVKCENCRLKEKDYLFYQKNVTNIMFYLAEHILNLVTTYSNDDFLNSINTLCMKQLFPNRIG